MALTEDSPYPGRTLVCSVSSIGTKRRVSSVTDLVVPYKDTENMCKLKVLWNASGRVSLRNREKQIKTL